MRLWLTYIALIVAAIIVLMDGIWFLNSFLRVTSRRASCRTRWFCSCLEAAFLLTTSAGSINAAIDFTSTVDPNNVRRAGRSRQSRQIAWARYENSRGLRIDAIAHRDVASFASTNVDGDLLAPLAQRLSLSLATARHSDIGQVGVLSPNGGPRKFFFGLRLR